MPRLLISWFFLALSVSFAFAQSLAIDGTTTETYEKSVRAMADTLGEDDKAVFAKGLINLVVTRYPPTTGAKTFAEMLPFMEAAVKAANITMDGVTLDEIMERGRSLESKQTDTNANENAADKPQDQMRACLQRYVKISDAQIIRRDFGRNVRMKITNGLKWAIAGIRINYIAKSDGRSVPWAKDDFSLSISGGIEPGETREIATTAASIPNEAPNKLSVSATVLDVSDPEERQLIRDVRVIGWADEKSSFACE